MIDPSIVPRGDRQRALFAEIERRGLTLQRLHADGPAVRLSGPGVFVTAATVDGITRGDLKPAGPGDEGRWAAGYAHARRLGG